MNKLLTLVLGVVFRRLRPPGPRRALVTRNPESAARIVQLGLLLNW